MSKYLRKYDENLYYIDTDGIKVDCELDKSEIDSKELGKMKYEYTFKEAVFPGLKVYGGILLRLYFLYEIVKVKGLKVEISHYHLNTMNNKDTPSIIGQEKWYYKLERSAIIVKSDRYTLALNENKRELIFNSWGDFVDSIPYYLNNGVLVNRNPATLHYLPAPSTINKASGLPEKYFQPKEIKVREEKWIKDNPLYSYEKLISNAIHESMMVAGNEARMSIYKITGIMYTIDGDIYYFEGEGHKSRRVYIKRNGVWLNSNIILKSGRLLFETGNWFSSSPQIDQYSNVEEIDLDLDDRDQAEVLHPNLEKLPNKYK
jgi:hypothetical protein